MQERQQQESTRRDDTEQQPIVSTGETTVVRSYVNQVQGKGARYAEAARKMAEDGKLTKDAQLAEGWVRGQRNEGGE
jgi:hypothetical protein